MKITTDHYAPNAWSAVDIDTCDGAPDAYSQMGHGATQWEAIRDLVDQLEERELADQPSTAGPHTAGGNT